MITSLKFNKKIKNLFQEGEVIELKPLTALVGDNGTGKSTLLNTLSDHLQHNNRIFGKTYDGIVLTSYMFMDFEKDNPRTKNGDGAGIFSVFSNFRSHGETNMDLICNHFSEFKNKLVLLDEPDQALSIRSIYRMKSVFDKMIENGCQIIVAVHSETMIRMVGDVYSVEHHKWMDSFEFLETQKKPKRMRTVDKFQENVYYTIRFIKEKGDKVFFPYRGKIDYFSSCRSIAYARRFKKKETAERNAKKEMQRYNDEFDRASNFEQNFFDGGRIVSYEIVEEEELFPDE